MKGFKLTKQQLQVLRLAHKEAKRRNAHAAYKINAVILLGTGWTVKMVKEALLLDDETLRAYVEKYQAGGIELLTSTHYPGRAPNLDEQQIDRLKAELDSKIYLTTSAVVEYVYECFGIVYSITGIRDLLHRIGYEYKKPKLVPGNPDYEEQALFVEQYEAFMLKKRGDVEVLFVDAVHPEHNTMAAYGWIKRGEAKEMKTNSGRQRMNLHGAMNAETLEVTVIESTTVNKDSTIDLIQVLDQKYFLARQIILILDNARYHYSLEVLSALENHPRVKLVFLPSYSPNLNLIERLWKFFKKKVLYNQYYANLNEFREASIGFFRNIDDYANELKAIMAGGFELKSS